MYLKSAESGKGSYYKYVPKYRIWHFLQFISNRENTHGMSNPVFWEVQDKNIEYLSFAELAQRVLKVIILLNFSR